MTEDELINYIIKHPHIITKIALKLENALNNNVEKNHVEVDYKNIIQIFEPRYKDNMVLISGYKIKSGKTS